MAKMAKMAKINFVHFVHIVRRGLLEVTSRALFDFAMQKVHRWSTLDKKYRTLEICGVTFGVTDILISVKMLKLKYVVLEFL